MSAIRHPAVAGSFYPADPMSLDASVASFLDAVRAGQSCPAPKALIVPHAGYVYSGPIAAAAFITLRHPSSPIERVVLLGPSHRVALCGLAATEAEIFATPLGEIPIDREALERVLPLPQVHLLESAHAFEHSLEVQLPFLQKLLPEFTLAPFAVGDARTEEVAEVLEELWGGPETLIVVSSDLSHYLDYDSARRMDAETSQAIEALEPEGVGPESACGRVPVRGLLLAAKRHGLRARTVDLRNSGDTAGNRDQVVGYGAYVFA
jgi:AmmeMemoRadiSam system protein B